MNRNIIIKNYEDLLKIIERDTFIPIYKYFDVGEEPQKGEVGKLDGDRILDGNYLLKNNLIEKT